MIRSKENFYQNKNQTVILTFLLFFISNIYSQKYKVTYNGTVYTDFCEPDPYVSNSALSTISLDNNVFISATCNKPMYALNQVKIINFKPSEIISTVRFQARNGNPVKTLKDIIKINLSHCDSWTGNYTLFPNTANTGIDYFSFSIEPAINLILPSIDPSCKVYISADELGFDSVVYNWQYKKPDGDWDFLPSIFQGKSNFEIKLADIFGADSNLYYNQTIYFRIQYCSGKYTNIIAFNFVNCSPGLVQKPITSRANCADEATGSVTLKFESSIKDDEKLFLNLFKNSSTPILIDNIFVPKSSIINNEFTWTGFEKGNYIIKYQVQSTSDNSEDLNSSLVITDEFIVDSPLPLKFEIKKADNPICADDPVEVSIAVAGGTGDYKFYVDGVEKTNPKPVKEADGYYHISGLIPTAMNSIKVTDQHGCIEKAL